MIPQSKFHNLEGGRYLMKCYGLKMMWTVGTFLSLVRLLVLNVLVLKDLRLDPLILSQILFLIS